MFLILLKYIFTFLNLHMDKSFSYDVIFYFYPFPGLNSFMGKKYVVKRMNFLIFTRKFFASVLYHL